MNNQIIAGRCMAGSLAILLAALGATPAAAKVTDADRQAARNTLEQIIAMRTAQGQGKVPAMARLLADKLMAAGFAPDDIQVVELDKDGETIAGLVVRYQGSNTSLKPIAILGHMDVVDALPANWTSDPYVPVEKEGYIYGRGAVDNKAGIAAVTTTFASLKKSGFQPERTLLIAFSGDEESGMRSTRALTTHPWVKEAEFALNSDAGSGEVKDGKYTFNIQSAEKTFATYFVSATNRGGHSSAPRPDNAIYDLAKALTAIEGIKFPVKFNEITRGTVSRLAATTGGEVGTALNALLKNPADANARATMEKHPEHTNILWTTCVATMLQAGNAPNALPQNATATVNCRIFPGTTVADVQADLQKAIANQNVSVVLDGEAVESPVSPVRPKLFTALRAAIHANYRGATVEPSMSAGGTDGREYRRIGIPTYGAGSLALRRPEDSRAHGIDERVPIEAFYKELNYWDTLLRNVSKAGVAG